MDRALRGYTGTLCTFHSIFLKIVENEASKPGGSRTYPMWVFFLPWSYRPTSRVAPEEKCLKLLASFDSSPISF